jgi:asparagine synthase (glutamine-hydrolysing)
MCGIAGIISTTNILAREQLQQQLQAMTNALAHRGPDGEGYWYNPGSQVFLGHRRLAIIDPSVAGAQPMHFAGRYTIHYNGELYNYIEIRETLLHKGYQFRSQTDTEVILAAYDCYGENCLAAFDGMFAFAIWDEKEQVLFAARDRFGEKPFFYTEDENAFYWASEIKAFTAADLPLSPRHYLLLNFITPGLLQDPDDPQATFFAEVQSLPPAHFLRYEASTGQRQETRYWSLSPVVADTLSPQAITDQLLSLLHTAVQRRLRSDVRVGTSLSGGLDSSAIAALLHEQGIALSHFSAVFPGFDKDESAHIQQVSDAFQLQGYATSPTADEFVKDFERLCFCQDEPFGSASVYAQYRVFALAQQQGVPVLLDGQGADEVLAGYPRYLHWFLQERWRTDRAGFVRDKKALADNGHAIHWGWGNRLAALWPGPAAKQLQRKAIRQQQQTGFNRDYLEAYARPESLKKPVVKTLNDILQYSIAQAGLPELLRYADRNSMACSREVRLPFLSHELVAFLFSLPSTVKIQKGFTKYPLRLAMQERLPESITWRKDKIGFEPPQVKWLQHPDMQLYMYEARERLVRYSILDKKVLDKPLQLHAAHAAGNFDWRCLVVAHTLL